MGPQLFSRGDLAFSRADNCQWPASMGPQLFSRGDQSNGGIITNNTAGFNGATAFQPWRSEVAKEKERLQYELQWGHSFSAVEILRSRENCPVMFMLQWGHSFSAVEICCVRLMT